MIDKIIANSSQPPIIILQADHGPASMLDQESLDNTNIKERMAILNALYLPGDGDKGLYPSITPVNTFRIIFNHYFGTNYSLLKGTIPAEQLIRVAVKYNLPALAITDTNAMNGAIQFVKIALENNIKPIIGCLIDEPDDSSTYVILLAKKIFQST